MSSRWMQHPIYIPPKQYFRDPLCCYTSKQRPYGCTMKLGSLSQWFAHRRKGFFPHFEIPLLRHSNGAPHKPNKNPTCIKCCTRSIPRPNTFPTSSPCFIGSGSVSSQVAMAANTARPELADTPSRRCVRTPWRVRMPANPSRSSFLIFGFLQLPNSLFRLWRDF